jgi:ribonucleoside-triphosphate reductase (formate)
MAFHQQGLNNNNVSINIGLDKEFIGLIDSIPTEIRGVEGILELDPFEFRRTFLDSMSCVADNSIDPNANMDSKSPVSLTAEMFKPLQKLDGLHVLWKHVKTKYGDEVADRAARAMIDGLIYFHDSTKTHIPYCIAASSYNILLTGLPFGAYPAPPKRSDSYTNQVIEFIMQMAQEVAGAVAVPDYFVNYAWFSKREGKSEYDIKQDQERLVFTVNNNFRIGGDSPFTNLPIFDKTTFIKLFGELYFPDGTPALDYWDEVERVQDIFCKWFSEGHKGLPHKFPVVTINVSAGLNGVIHEDYLERMMNYNKKLCCFNFYVGEKLASCCRLTSDLEEMRKNIRFNSGFGNGGLNIGSHRVVAVNLHRVALGAKYTNGRSFFDRLDDALELAGKLLDIHRNSILQKRIEQGFLRFFNHKWLDLNMFFSTLGQIGLADAVYTMTGCNTTDEKGHEFAKSVLDYMEKKAKEFTERYGCAFNVEECPAEGAAAKLAKKDSFYFGNEASEDDLPYLLANQTVPLEENVSIIQRAKVMGDLMQMSGGSIAHFNVVDDDPDPHSLFLFAKRLVGECKIPHFALNKGLSVCSEDDTHITHHLTDTCSICGAEIKEQITRVVGYFVPVSKWGKPRRKGLQNRKFYFLNGADHDSEPRSISVCKSSAVC